MFLRRSLLSWIVAALSVAIPASVLAQSEAKVFVVHGIPGGDVALPATAPVDVSVNGACFLRGFTFGQIVGPVALPAGNYTIAISVANSTQPCANSAVIGPVTIPIAPGEQASLVAHLTSAGAPTASKFVNDLSPTGPGRARLLVHHTAAAPAVDVAASRNLSSGAPSLTVPDVVNGDQAVAPIRPGQWEVGISPAGTTTLAFGPARLNLRPFTAYLVYAVGTVSTGSFTLLVKDVGDLKR